MGRATKQNRIVTPELLEQVNNKNKELAKDFLLYLKSIDRSETTVEAYRQDLNIIMVFLLQQCDNRFFVDMTKRDIIRFQNWLIEDHGNSPARIRRLKAVVSSLSNYIETILDEDYPQYRSIVKKIESPVNVPVREKTVMTEDECQQMLDVLVSRGELDKACMFSLADNSGRRKSELVRFKVGYFTDDNVLYGSLYRTPEKVKSKGRGKQGKMLNFYVLKKNFDPYMRMWMEERERRGIVSEWLFPDPDDPTKHIEATRLNSWAKSFSSLLGRPFYWHALRHRFTTKLSQAGLPDDAIQSILGWNSRDMVAIYRDVDETEELGKYFRDGEIISQKRMGLQDLWRCGTK